MTKVTIHTMYAGNDISSDLEMDDVIVYVVEELDTNCFIHASLNLFRIEIWCDSQGYQVIPIHEAYEYADEVGWERSLTPATVNRFLYNVYVDCETPEQAAAIIAERLDYDEQYEDENGIKYDYRIGLV